MGAPDGPAFVAESFRQLYVVQGRPTRARAEVEERHEFCEDLAQQTADVCRAAQRQLDLSHNETLVRCRAGLQEVELSRAEAGWVLRRVVEIAGWQVPAWMAEGSGEQQSG